VISPQSRTKRIGTISSVRVMLCKQRYGCVCYLCKDETLAAAWASRRPTGALAWEIDGCELLGVAYFNERAEDLTARGRGSGQEVYVRPSLSRVPDALSAKGSS
jgi:hypothetical protein